MANEYAVHEPRKEAWGWNNRVMGDCEAIQWAFHNAHSRARAIQARGMAAWVCRRYKGKVIDVWHYQMDGKIRYNGVWINERYTKV